eukprot:CAMPEP_0184294846 /NCGR_PEP_ID=MMETSP1049-20130417/5924_1 /TAXON_ID=77928 /ORGANISM="Proteomonas sulcata, Strain CCMP704" /LENGTH=99 /DNA_ID=CAMNT_0026603259 /DNA_START=601 /DNA_END=900 /DNA_ORIENTATION=+
MVLRAAPAAKFLGSFRNPWTESLDTFNSAITALTKISPRGEDPTAPKFAGPLCAPSGAGDSDINCLASLTTEPIDGKANTSPKVTTKSIIRVASRFGAR